MQVLQWGQVLTRRVEERESEKGQLNGDGRVLHKVTIRKAAKPRFVILIRDCWIVRKNGQGKVGRGIDVSCQDGRIHIGRVFWCLGKLEDGTEGVAGTDYIFETPTADMYTSQ